MTNDERATIYGRAMLELKECDADIAALATYFSAYAERLQSASGLAKRFLLDPLAKSTEYIAFSERVKEDNLRLTRADFGDKVDEMVRLVGRAQELKAQVEKF